VRRSGGQGPNASAGRAKAPSRPSCLWRVRPRRGRCVHRGVLSATAALPAREPHCVSAGAPSRRRPYDGTFLAEMERALRAIPSSAHRHFGIVRNAVGGDDMLRQRLDVGRAQGPVETDIDDDARGSEQPTRRRRWQGQGPFREDDRPWSRNATAMVALRVPAGSGAGATIYPSRRRSAPPPRRWASGVLPWAIRKVAAGARRG
jgi:hypothetical protein